MKSTGIVRKMDELGRVVLPMELRRTLHIEEGDALEIFVEEDRIILRKHQVGCIFCNETEGLTIIKGKPVCAACAREIGCLSKT